MLIFLNHFSVELNNMTKIDDMELFVRVVQAEGLAAAGRQLGLSPASMTARIKTLEARYNTRLLNRSTRSLSLTDAGHRFYQACLRVLAEVADAEAAIRQDEGVLSGSLRVTAASDFGRQFVAPALAEFVQEHEAVNPHLYLTDGVVNLIAAGFDLGIRFGNLPDSNLIIRPLARDNRRVLCASPEYLKRYGVPQKPKNLEQHRCLVMERFGEPLNQWHFQNDHGKQTIKVNAALSSNDGALIRQWALASSGIAIKSTWDIKSDVVAGRLITVLDDYAVSFQTEENEVGLQVIYPSRKYLPRQVASFIDYFIAYISE